VRALFIESAGSILGDQQHPQQEATGASMAGDSSTVKQQQQPGAAILG